MMTDSQKLVWTIAFGGLYLIAGTRACNWLTSQLSNPTTLVQFWMLPLIAFVIAAPGSFLIFKMWKND